MIENLKYRLSSDTYNFKNLNKDEISKKFWDIETSKRYTLGDCLMKHRNVFNNEMSFELSRIKPRGLYNNRFDTKNCANPPETLRFDKRYNKFIINMEDFSFCQLFKFHKYNDFDEKLFGIYTKELIKYFKYIEIIKSICNSIEYLNNLKVEDLNDYEKFETNVYMLEKLYFLPDNVQEELFGEVRKYFWTEKWGDGPYDLFRFIEVNFVIDNVIPNIKKIEEEFLKLIASYKLELLIKKDILKYISKNGDFESFYIEIKKEVEEIIETIKKKECND